MRIYFHSFFSIILLSYKYKYIRNMKFGKSNLFQKAKQQPDKVKEVLNKIKTDGLKPTINAVFNKLGQPLPLGYCNVGKVIAVGPGRHVAGVGFIPTEIKIGDIVILPTMGFARLQFEGEEYFIGPENQILARVNKEENKEENE